MCELQIFCTFQEFSYFSKDVDIRLQDQLQRQEKYNRLSSVNLAFLIHCLYVTLEKKDKVNKAVIGKQWNNTLSFPKKKKSN